MKKIISFILILTMLLPSFAFAQGEEESSWLTALEEKSLQLNDQTWLCSGWYENTDSESADTLLAENYLVYEPGESVQPLVCFGNDVSGAAGFSRIVEIEAEAGNNVMAGINGDYFTMSTGVAMGFIVKNGRVCSSERTGCESVGFLEDGSVIIGSPGLVVSVTNETTGYSVSQLCFNKTLNDDDGLVVYSDDFGATNEAGSHRSVVISVTGGAILSPGSVVTGTIESVEALTGPKALEEGKLVLSVSETTKYTGVLAAVGAMSVGDTVTVSFQMNEEWLSVVNAVGTERRLLSDGTISENILADAQDGEDSTRDPRTALGIRSDGSVVLYTADGRSKSHSSGLTYLELATRLLELGCVEAVNLDGGGSTQIYVTYPGDGSVSQVNKSVGTTVRRCADYLCLVNQAEATGQLAHLNLYPYQERVLAGASLPLTLKGSDDGWYPLDIGSSIPVWSVSGGLGTVENGSFLAGNKAGTAVVSAHIGSVCGTVEIEIVTRPDAINVTGEDGKAVGERLYIYEGESLQLKASATYKRQPLTADDSCFTWAVSEGFGTVENGLFTASGFSAGQDEESAESQQMEGFITVTAGEVSKSIPVTVYKDETPPVITGEISGNLLMANVSDNCSWSFDQSCISVRYDGVSQDFTYTDSGDVYLTLPEADGDLHHLVIEATDARGNKSRLGLEVRDDAPLLDSDGFEIVKSCIFSDLNENNVVTPYAEYLSRRGLMSGKLNSGVLLFDPDACLTRQEFAAVICNALGYDPYAYEETELPFTDLDAISPWAVLFVKAAYEEGAMAGKAAGDGTLLFDPQGKITRQEAITVLAKMLGEGYKSEALDCVDASDVSGWAAGFLQLAVTNGIIQAQDGLLRPLDNISRGELALMLYAMD